MYKEIPCILSEELLNQILREKLGFKNMIVSDYGAINRHGLCMAIQKMR